MGMRKPPVGASPEQHARYARTLETKRIRDRRNYHKNLAKQREKHKRWRANNPSKAAAAEVKWKTANPAKVRSYKHKSRASMNPWYIRELLDIKLRETPPELMGLVGQLITAKREQIKLCRLIRQKKKEETT